MDLTVIDATGSKTQPVSLPDTVDVDRIIPRLVEAMKLPNLGADGRALSYGLEHQPSGRTIDAASTLVQAGVKENDLLRLVARDLVTEPLAPAPAPARASSVGDYGYFPPAVSAQSPAAFPPAPAADTRWRRVVFIVASVAAVLAVGVGGALATGALSGGSRGHARASRVTRSPVTVSTALKVPPESSEPTPREQVSGRAKIMSLLSDYAETYSAHNLSALSKLLAPEISRHGLAASGCTVAHGRSAVLGDYQSQFEEGSGSYTLVGLSDVQIRFNSTTHAYLDAHYRITPGGSGYVNFRFAVGAEGWKISEVYATCD
jgi:hypothetical protein